MIIRSDDEEPSLPKQLGAFAQQRSGLDLTVQYLSRLARPFHSDRHEEIALGYSIGLRKDQAIPGLQVFSFRTRLRRDGFNGPCRPEHVSLGINHKQVSETPFKLLIQNNGVKSRTIPVDLLVCDRR
jgi:hypothetical protein